jgi:hypothetical protein
MSPGKTSPRRTHRVMLGLAALATSVVIAACGSSSTTATTSTTTAASASATATANRTAFAKCLKQQGVTIPQGAAGGRTHAGPPPAGATGAGGTNSSARQAAFKACGANGQHFGRASSTATTTG